MPYRQNKLNYTTIKINNSYQDEPLEAKIRKLLNNKEPLTGNDTKPLIYSERNEGINAAYDIKTDRWEIAVEASDTLDRANKAKRGQRHKTETGTPETGAEAAKGMAAESKA